MKTCKYCGNEYSGTSKDTCANCVTKRALIPRFVQARDTIRRKTGMRPIKGRC